MIVATTQRRFGYSVRWPTRAMPPPRTPSASCTPPAGACRTGHGVRQDYTTAVTWYRKAAEQGLAPAQSNLGLAYTFGHGVRQDYSAAATWYRDAAEQGHPKAQNNLGDMYRTGQGVPQDYTQAATWYRRAADQGNAVAQHNLGVAYATGQGVLRDRVQAYKWLSLAAERYPASEIERREMAIGSRDKLAAEMTATEIAEARRLAREWTPK